MAHVLQLRVRLQSTVVNPHVAQRGAPKCHRRKDEKVTFALHPKDVPAPKKFYCIGCLELRR